MIYSLKKIKSNCPLCFSKDGLLLYEIDSETVTRGFFSKDKDPEQFLKMKKIIEKLWKGGKCKKILCSNCSLVYSTPFIGGNQEFYSIIYKKGEYPAWRWEYELTSNIIKELPKEERESILEIGAGNGSFIKKISPLLIYKENVLCLEYSEEGCKKITDLGFKCTRENFINLKTKKKYSITCMFQILEHMDNLKETIEKIKLLSHKNSHIFISVPCIKTIMENEKKGSILDLPPTHISGWSKKAFGKLCELYNFELIDYKEKESYLLRKMINFAMGRFERGKLKENSLASKIDAIRNKLVRKLFILIFMLIKITPNFYKIIKTKMIETEWAHIKNKD